MLALSSQQQIAQSHTVRIKEQPSVGKFKSLRKTARDATDGVDVYSLDFAEQRLILSLWGMQSIPYSISMSVDLWHY
jgi:hypothetical protein